MDWARCEIVEIGGVEPIDLVTAVAAVAIGLRLDRRGHRRVGWALIASGLASTAYHATATAFAGWLDAVGVVLVAFAFVVDALRWRRMTIMAVGVVLAAALVAEPLRPTVTALVVGGAVAAVLARGRVHPAAIVAAVALFGTGVIAWIIGSTDTLCSADGWFPTHAVWHLTAAAAVAVLARGRRAAAGHSSPNAP